MTNMKATKYYYNNDISHLSNTKQTSVRVLLDRVTMQ